MQTVLEPPVLSGTEAPLHNARTLILDELEATLDTLDDQQTAAATQAILRARSIFTCGAGRSGLALKMAAMRLMHLGLTVYVVGETTTPAIGSGDLLLVASASGTTSSVVQAAQTASRAGAPILALTTQPDSPLGYLATSTLVLKAATKQQLGQRASQQYAGSLFEQSVLLTLDLLFHALWQGSPQSAEQLMKRHANLE